MGTKAIQIETLMNGLIDDEGNPVSGGKVYTYTNGTTTPKDTWTDRAKTTLAANPIILDTYGRAEVYADGLYKFVVKDANDVTLYDSDDVEYISREGQAGNFTSLTVNNTVTIDGILDEDTMASNSATKVPTQQSVKAYVDNVKDVYNFYVKYPYVNASGTIQEQLIARPGSISKIDAILGTDATGAAFIVDILNNGTAVKKSGDTYTFSDITNTITNKTDADTAIAATAGQYLGVRIHQVGSTVIGQDLRIQVTITRS